MATEEKVEKEEAKMDLSLRTVTSLRSSRSAKPSTIEIYWDKEEEAIVSVQQWEDDWDDDHVNDDFSLQLRMELESNNEKK